jgi:putative FmdB family regulatory protein
MPIYEYTCAACNHRFSVLQRIGEGNEHLTCEKCGAPKPIKQFSSFASSGSGSEQRPFATSRASGGSRFT